MMSRAPRSPTDPPTVSKPASPPPKDAPSDVDIQSFKDNHGLYYQQPDKLVPIEGQVVSFSRTGSLLSSTVTFGIRSKKANVQILGHTSGHVTGREPVFFYRTAAGTEAAGGSAGDLVLLKMTSKGDRRQFEMGAVGDARASSGISIRAQIQVVRKQAEADLYRLSPAQKLEPGEYAFYLFRGYNLPGFLYDFTVE